MSEIDDITLERRAKQKLITEAQFLSVPRPDRIKRMHKLFDAMLIGEWPHILECHGEEAYQVEKSLRGIAASYNKAARVRYEKIAVFTQINGFLFRKVPVSQLTTNSTYSPYPT